MTLAIAALIALPIFSVLGSVFTDSGEIWRHLVDTVLGRYVFNSLWLMLGVGVGVTVVGVATAWLVTMCRFRGQSFWEVLLLLPLAAPAYLLAYIYTDILDYFGWVQRFLRLIFGWQSAQDYWFPEVRSLGGAIIMLILVLYPYVYLLARVAFLEQSVTTLEASRALGCGPWKSFWAIALPLARPAITAGLALALMETLNDFGTVQYFGVETFTTGIYRTWFGLGAPQAAAQLAAVLMLFIAGLLVLEKWSRHQAQYYQTSNNYDKPQAYELRGWRAGVATMTCGIPVFFGFVVPVGTLLEMAFNRPQARFRTQFWEFAQHSFVLASVTAILAVAIALILAYGQRLNHSLWMALGVRIASLGYAIPGSVIAVGILIPMGKLDNAIANFFQAQFNISTGLLLSGTITALVFAYLVRFLAVSFGAVETSLGKIKPTLDDASRSLGYTPIRTLVSVHTPLMWSGLLTAAMLVFVDVMKELPATLVIRPFNFDTLAVKVYQYASDERLVEASVPALAILAVGLIPVIFLSWRIAHVRNE
ncbi:ABC transporter permease [Picosynechococcus sp. PCC 8807]|uniref:ABC transporter permease n=2 Tax=unclassified Picosynechococcus TaxID=3079910 RepID=UPI000A7358CA|nr:iron ABC transporter permease [Picosynechococcus sp. PCC 8807]